MPDHRSLHPGGITGWLMLTIRRAVGSAQIVAKLRAIDDRTRRMETAMATAAEQLSELRAAVTDAFADVNAKLDQLAAAQGELTPEAQEIFDDIKNRVSELDSRVGDADGSDTPPAPPADTF